MQAKHAENLRMNNSSSTSSGSSRYGESEVGSFLNRRGNELEAGSFFSRSSGSVGSRSPQLSPWGRSSRVDSESVPSARSRGGVGKMLQQLAQMQTQQFQQISTSRYIHSVLENIASKQEGIMEIIYTVLSRRD